MGQKARMRGCQGNGWWGTNLLIGQVGLSSRDSGLDLPVVWGSTFEKPQNGHCSLLLESGHSSIAPSS